MTRPIFPDDAPIILAIIADLINASREANTAHALELAQCQAELRAASELLQRERTRIEYLTTTITQLMDVINRTEKTS